MSRLDRVRRLAQPAPRVAVSDVENGRQDLDGVVSCGEGRAACRHAGLDGIRIGLLDQKAERFFLVAEIVVERPPRDIDDPGDGDHRQLRVPVVQESPFQP